MAESADATDLKSVGGDTVRVRPPLAPQKVEHPPLHTSGDVPLKAPRPTVLERGRHKCVCAYFHIEESEKSNSLFCRIVRF